MKISQNFIKPHYNFVNLTDFSPQVMACMLLLDLSLNSKKGENLDKSTGVAPIQHLRTCAIKIVTFKGGHLM